MSPIIWENCRKLDGSLDLREAATHTGCYFSQMAMEYLVVVEKLRPIKSRQAAAIAIATAIEISTRS